MDDSNKNNIFGRKTSKNKLNLRKLRLSLKFRPEIYNLIMKMRHNIKKKARQIKDLKHSLKNMEKSVKDKATNTDEYSNTSTNSSKIETKLDNPIKIESKKEETKIPVTEVQSKDSKTASTSDRELEKDTLWNVNNNEEGKSIADQVKEAAQSALQQSGMVYVESAGMYYDYKTGYYYNSELGLYYHTDTGCYYYYSEDKKEFVFHSYPDRSALAANASLIAHNKRKARKQNKAMKKEEDIDELTKNLSQDEEPKAKRKKSNKKTKKYTQEKETDISVKENDIENKEDNTEAKEMEDGECSETESDSSSGEESDASTATASDDDAVAKHHPPCMRVIVRETNLSKLKVGSLYLVTKDGGTIGREGSQHTILLKDHNVSRNHLDIKYDMQRRMYVATDLGSKNGTLLNGSQMSQSQVVSDPMEIVHGSIIQLGETKLLCHIHPGNDTCGHCEPGLLLETQEKEKSAYTRTCSVQKQHQLELARLKNKYAPEPLMIEEGTYNDRAKARREAVGSSHHSEKTQSADIDTSIAPENKGFKLLEKMGWSKGEGLGKHNQGDAEPIPLVSNEGKVGLGNPGSAVTPQPAPPKKYNKFGKATLRLAARTKILQPPAKAFKSMGDDEDDDE